MFQAFQPRQFKSFLFFPQEKDVDTLKNNFFHDYKKFYHRIAEGYFIAIQYFYHKYLLCMDNCMRNLQLQQVLIKYDSFTLHFMLRMSLAPDQI